MWVNVGISHIFPYPHGIFPAMVTVTEYRKASKNILPQRIYNSKTIYSFCNSTTRDLLGRSPRIPKTLKIIMDLSRNQITESSSRCFFFSQLYFFSRSLVVEPANQLVEQSLSKTLDLVTGQ